MHFLKVKLAAGHTHRTRMAFHLPLFPLNTVLFPGAGLPLHIFEARYRLMVRRCLEATEHAREFGVLLIAEGQEVGAPATPHRVGTIARIGQLEPRDDGRLDLATQGEERFVLQESWEHDGYLEGKVELLDDGPDDSTSLQLCALKTHALFDRYVSMVLGEEEARQLLRAVPAHPTRLSFLIAAAIPVSLERKQRLLELTSAGRRLETLGGMLQQQMLMRQVIQRARSVQPPEAEARAALN